MSPQKLFCCYRFTYSRTGRTKLENTWYVSNVSIISDVPCWYYANRYMFPLHFIAFYAFSGTNLLIRCHSVSSCFLLFLYFRKVVLEIFSELDETKAKSPYFYDTHQESEGDPKGARGAATPGGGAGPLGRTATWCGPLGHPLTSLFRLFIPFLGKTLKTQASIHEKFRSRRHRQP